MAGKIFLQNIICANLNLTAKGMNILYTRFFFDNVYVNENFPLMMWNIVTKLRNKPDEYNYIGIDADYS